MFNVCLQFQVPLFFACLFCSAISLLLSHLSANFMLINLCSIYTFHKKLTAKLNTFTASGDLPHMLEAEPPHVLLQNGMNVLQGWLT